MVLIKMVVLLLLVDSDNKNIVLQAWKALSSSVRCRIIALPQFHQRGAVDLKEQRLVCAPLSVHT